jgi:SAM-dependent methyltransferase
MADWSDIYLPENIDRLPSDEIVELVTRLKKEGVVEVLDAGCGTGRNSLYLASEGFRVHAVDISEQAIKIAKYNSCGFQIDFRVVGIADLPYADRSMDFVLAAHSLEYGSDEYISSSVRSLDRVLRINRPLLVKVDSTQHPFYGIDPHDIDEVSHIGIWMKKGLPIHFFTRDEIIELFKGYNIERLYHISLGSKEDKISPIREWVLFGYKKG